MFHTFRKRLPGYLPLKSTYSNKRTAAVQLISRKTLPGEDVGQEMFFMQRVG